MTTYRSARRDLAVADDYLANHAARRFCGHSTPTEDLATYGARCRPCYDAYQAEANPSWWPNRRLTPEERSSVIRKAKRELGELGNANREPKSWAHALKAREEAGEALGEFKAKAWREALRQPVPRARAFAEEARA